MEDNFKEELENTMGKINNDDDEQAVFTDDEIKKLGTNKTGILVGVGAILLVLLLVVGWYFLILNNPTRVYIKIIVQSINTLSSFSVSEYYNKTNFTIKTDMDVNVGFSMIDQELLNFINKTTGSFNYQIDKSNKKLFLNLNLDYDNEKLLNYDLLIDGNSKNMYVYLEDLYDKYLSAKLDDNPLYMAIFEETASIIDEQVDFTKMQKIITKELTEIIESEDCYKEDKLFVYEIKISKLMKRVEDMLDDLADDEEFLGCFADKKAAREFLEAMEYLADAYSANDSIKISTSLKYNKLEKMIISFGSNDIVVEFENNSIEYSVKAEGQSLMNGYFKTVTEKNTRKLEISSNIPMFVDIKLNFEITDNGESNIKAIDEANIKLVDELTENELSQILSNLQKSKIYELIEKLEGGSLSGFDDSLNNDFDFAMNNNF